jgi:hypothetical protein
MRQPVLITDPATRTVRLAATTTRESLATFSSRTLRPLVVSTTCSFRSTR